MSDDHATRTPALAVESEREPDGLSTAGLETRELVGKADGEGLFDLATTVDGGHACIFCGVCARRCPVSAISVRLDSKSKTAGKRAQFAGSIVIDEQRCIACGHCVEACALSALVPTANYESHRQNWQRQTDREVKLASGHSMCSGCAAPTAVNMILSAVDSHHVVAGATGCLEVSTTRYPMTAWHGSYIHTAFENAAATLSGVETAFRALSKRGKLDERVKFIAFGGDGGTYDIGLQSLSGAMERGHSMLYVCYDNGGYMNTGFQRSSATPAGAWTSTSPVGQAGAGKAQQSKNLTEIMVAHRIPYVAQASPHDPRDLMRKASTALSYDGPTFLNVISPCPRGWRTESDESISLARLATETCYWPLFEVESGRYKLNYRPGKKKPLATWLELQGRFAHMAHEDFEYLVQILQDSVDSEWDLLLRKCDELPEAMWQTQRERRKQENVVHPRPLHTVALGEPLSASMTEATLDHHWGMTSSAMAWGGFED